MKGGTNVCRGIKGNNKNPFTSIIELIIFHKSIKITPNDPKKCCWLT